MPLRRRRPAAPHASPAPLVDLAALTPASRRAVAQALDARERFERITGRVAAGPVRDRLRTLAERVDAGVVAAHSLAVRADASQATLADLRPEAITARVKDARRALSTVEAAGGDGAAERATLDALLAQHASTMRVWDAVDDCRERLAHLNRRLEDAVVHAGALATSNAVDDPVLGAIEADLAAASDELAAIGEALDALDRP